MNGQFDFSRKPFGEFFVHVLILACCLMSYAGCYTYTSGELVGSEDIVGSKVFSGYKIELRILSSPSSTNPRLLFQIDSIPSFTSKKVEKFKEIRTRSSSWMTWRDIFAWTGVAPTILGLGYLIDTSKSAQDERGAGVALLAGGLLSLGTAVLIATADSLPKETGRLTKGGIYADSYEGERSPMKRCITLAAHFGSTNKNVHIDSTGNGSVNLVGDWGLSTFAFPEPLRVTFSSESPEFEKEVVLDPGDWTVPYIRITRSEVPVKGSNYEKSKTMGKAIAREEYLLLEDNPLSNEARAGYKIQFGNKEGWISADAGTKFWSIPERFEPKHPPSIGVSSVKFDEPRGDNFLHAEEMGNIRFRVENTGKGIGYRLTAKVSQVVPASSDLTFDKTTALGTLQAGEYKDFVISVAAPLDVKSRQNKFKIEVTEANGFDADPVELTFETRAFRPPEFAVDQAIDDANGNGIIELGESVDITARVQNKGEGEAKDVSAQVNVEGDGQNIFYQASSKQFTLGTLKPGEFKDITFTVVTNKRFTGDKLPVSVSIQEPHGTFDKKVELSLPLSRPIKRTSEFVVKGTEQAQIVVPEVGALSIDVEENIPESSLKNPDGVAVIIGISRYQNIDVPTVEYARRDATWMKKYLIKTFGFDERRIIEKYDNDASLAAFKQVFEEQLPDWIRPGTSDVFIYYSGHGAPDPETKEAFFVPYDCNPAYAKSTGYKLNEFYGQLSKLKARSITVVIDACFSGSSEKGSLLKGISPVFITVENPIAASENGIVFTSSTGQQVSTWYDEKKHSLFTYYFLKGLQGGADANADKQITVGEMETYLQANVPDQARYLRNREQTPQVSGKDKQRVLVKY